MSKIKYLQETTKKPGSAIVQIEMDIDREAGESKEHKAMNVAVLAFCVKLFKKAKAGKTGNGKVYKIWVDYKKNDARQNHIAKSKNSGSYDEVIVVDHNQLNDELVEKMFPEENDDE